MLRKLARLAATPVRNIPPGVAISLLMVVVLALAGEAYWRIKMPFDRPAWPTRFDRSFGFNFEPNATIRWTNHLDYWQVTKANADGFLDRPLPDSAAHPDTCNVAVIGDSFVEAAQVPIAKKFPEVFERLGNRASLGVKFRAAGFGYSGTGQANQVPFYDVFARRFRPDVVVLVFVANDFANNSTLLESVRNGWAPDHAPRLFYVRDPKTGQGKALPIAADWQKHLLTQLQHKSGALWPVRQLHRLLTRSSYLYNWLFTNLSLRYPKIASAIVGNTPVKDVYSYHIAELRKTPAYKDELAGWHYPNDWDMDTMFYTEHLPKVFTDALAETGYAFDAFLKRAERDHFKLIVLSSVEVNRGPGAPFVSSRRAQGSPHRLANPVRNDGQIRKLQALLAQRHIPLIDLAVYIRDHGYDRKKATFPHDGHWAPQGHRWAAEALLQYVGHHRDLCPAGHGEPS